MNEFFNDEELVRQVSKNATDITKLKGNVKWLYQYGGVGGNGGGSGTTTSWSIYATLDGQVIKDNSTIILDNTVNHKLVISISKPNGLTYTIKSIRYFNGSTVITQSNFPKFGSGNYEYVYNNININGNAADNSTKLQIIIDCDEDPGQLSLSCYTICNPLTATSSFQIYKDGTYKPVGNKDAIYVSELENLYLTIGYNLYTSSSSTAKLVFKNNHIPFKNFPPSGEQILTDRSGILRYEIDESIFEDISYYGINIINVYIDIDDGSAEHKNLDLSTSCTLIPNDIFLRVSPYNSRNNIFNRIEYITDTRSFNTGMINLNLTGYYGAPNARTFSVSCLYTQIGTINDDGTWTSGTYTLPVLEDFLNESGLIDVSKNKLNTNILAELTQTKTYLNIADPGVYAISFVLGVEENARYIYSPVYTYYIYVAVAQNNANFIENIELEQLSNIYDEQGNKRDKLSDFNEAISSSYSYWYRFGQKTDNIAAAVSKYGSYITMSSNTEDFDLINLKNLSGNPLPQYVINIGIQYSAVNETSNPIFTLFGENTAYNITFYQNKIVYNNTELKFYLPLEKDYDPNNPSKYHLISITRQKMNDTQQCYSYVFYIDGIQEIALPGSWVNGIAYTGLTLHKANYSLNLIDVANITYEIEDKSTIYKLELRDQIISEYYLQYANNIFGIEIPDQLISSIQILNLSKNFIFEDNVIKVKDGLSTINSLKEALPNTDIMVLDLSESSYNTKDKFFNNFFFIDASQNKIKISFNSLYYNNFTDNSNIIIPNGYWGIEPQGSSTLTYKIKNLELSSNTYESDENASMYIFSPNFDSENKESYLPETSFTLKADEMDSSHCNNTSVGLFVNRNTTKFADVKSVPGISRSIYKDYIKNCLLGYPCMLFVQLQGEESKEIYYLGIYNFNLGRNSGFNLGYRDTEILDNIKAYNQETQSAYDEPGLRNGFNIYNIKVSAIDRQSENLCVAEIQGNDTRFDFSQYDESVLFDLSQGDKVDNNYMLGDIVPVYTDPNKKQEQKTLLKNFIRSISLAGGFIFDTLGKKMSDDLTTDEYGYKEGYGYKAAVEDFPQISMNMVPNYKHQSIRRLEGNISTYSYTDILPAQEEDLLKCIYGLYDEEVLLTLPTLDYMSVVEYYVLCMAFGMVDSVQKNLNIKSWTANNGNKGARFYVGFYDMDTSNGKTNSGGETNKYAFTNYWVTLHKNTSNILEQSSIFNDFYPVTSAGDAINNKPGYDTPSSYLFAIAKYASIFGFVGVNEIGKATGNICPENLWAKYRGKNGQLCNAKYFIDNYFYVNINKIPIQFISLNYRFKYLQLGNNNGQFETSTLEKFSGQAKYYAEDWLNDRFHILDAYFNLQQENKPVWKYDYAILNQVDFNEISSLDDPSIVQKYDYPLINSVIYNSQPLNYRSNNNDSNPEGYKVDSSNSDIYVANHIFNTKTDEPVKCMIKPFNISAYDMSPLIIKGTNSVVAGSYIIPDGNKTYNIGIVKESNENWIFGGSQLWTKLDNILPFIGENKQFYIKSDQIREIIGNQGTANSWEIHCPSLQILKLNGQNFTGTLDIDTAISNDWQNIKSINISNSNIQLKCSNANCNSINCNNINVGENGEIKIDNCQLLNNLLFDNIITKILKITPIHTNDILFSNIVVQELYISPKYENTSITIDNIKELQIVNISTFDDNSNINKLYINNCKNINSLNINSTFANKITSLKLTNCLLGSLENDGSKNELIYVEDNILHLEKLINLEELSLENSLGFNTVILPHRGENGQSETKIKLLPYAFKDTDVEYIRFDSIKEDYYNDGILVLCDNSTNPNTVGTDCAIFNNSKFTLTTSIDTTTQDLIFAIQEKPTTLSNLFRIEKDTYSAGAHNGEAKLGINKTKNFIENLRNKEYVTSFEYAFYRQSKIETDYFNNSKYSEYTLAQRDELLNIHFNDYYSLESIAYMFEMTKISIIPYNLFTYNDNTKITPNIINILNAWDSSQLQYVHIEAFKNIGNKIEKFIFEGSNDETGLDRKGLFGIYNYETNTLYDELDIKSFLSQFKENIVKLTGFSFTNRLLNFKDVFNETYVKLESLCDVFVNLSQRKEQGNFNLEPNTTIGLENLPKLNTLINAFNCAEFKLSEIDSDKLIDLTTFINFETQYVQIAKNLNDYNEKPENARRKAILFNFYKKINLQSEENRTKYKNIFESIKNQGELATNINYLLSKCIFFINSENNTVINIPVQLPSVTTANNFLSYSTAYDENNVEYGLNIDPLFMNQIPNVINISNMFKGSVFADYPLTDTFFDYSTNIEYMDSLFEDTRIISNNKTFYDENKQKETYYNKYITQDIWNFGFSDQHYSSNTEITKVYPFVPATLFSQLSNLNSLQRAFANCDFEGYLPQNLFRFNNNTVYALSETFKNCKILPQKYAEGITSDNIYNILIDERTNNKIPVDAYVFVPENFITFGTSSSLLAIDISFNLIISDKNTKRYYLMANNFIEDFNKLSTLSIDLGIDIFESKDKISFGNKKSTIIPFYTYNSSGDFVEYNADGWYKKANNIEYINSQVQCSIINFMINTKDQDDDNKYYEGLPAKYISKLLSSKPLINQYLGLRYYGYVFEKGTCISDTLWTQYINANNTTLVLFPDIKLNNNDKLDWDNYVHVSHNIILPQILGLDISRIWYYIDPQSQYFVNKLTSEVKNNYYKSNLGIRFSQTGAFLYDFMFDNDNYQETITKSISNYLLLFNDWSKGAETSEGEDRWHQPLGCYTNYNIVQNNKNAMITDGESTIVNSYMMYFTYNATYETKTINNITPNSL